jgi:catecholate siderophore receptor
LERSGINPTMTIAASQRTMLTLGYEHFRDDRVADRGIPSYNGRPADVDIATYYGDPNNSPVRARVNVASAAIEHQAGRFNLSNRVSFADYDRGYQNFVPGAVSTDKTFVALSAYNNATARRNVFNQTNLTYGASTGPIRHTFLSGVEAGRQLTDNFRNTGYFGNTSTTVSVAYSNPTISVPVTFRQSATDANNHLETKLAAAYVQDQVEVSRKLQVIAGMRFDYFDLRFHNNRTAENLRRIDNLVSPRAGIVFKPVVPVSIYGNYSVSYLPSSGDQFSSLTTVTQQVKPEKFNNYEVGMKWDLHRDLALTTAVYRLDRMNTRSTDPNDPTRIVQTGSTRSNGYEIGFNGGIVRAWRISGGYAYQDAFISRATTSAIAGARVPQVPRHMFSMWNNWQVMPRLGTGLGIIRRTDVYAAIDNSVVLPAYTRADAAVYVSLTEKIRLQANVENLFNTKYYVNADSNTNISPGSSRAVRVGLTAAF